jgi:hypothetical protein
MKKGLGLSDREDRAHTNYLENVVFTKATAFKAKRKESAGILTSKQ